MYFADVFDFQHVPVAPAAISVCTTPGMDTGETATETPPPAMACRYRHVALLYA
jgi:hypothetical protein